MNFILSFPLFVAYSVNTFDKHQEKNAGAGGKELRNRPLLHNQPSNNTMDIINNRVIIKNVE